MYGVDGRADVILEGFIKEEKAGKSRFDIDPEGPDAPYYAQLKQAGFVEAIGSWGQEVIIVHGVTAAGREHAQKVKQAKLAADFPMLANDDDALFRRCYEVAENEGNVDEEIMTEANADVLRRLENCGLIDAFHADNRPFYLKRITERGKKYAEDLIPESSDMSVSISPIFTNSPIFNNVASSEANAVATAISETSITDVMKAIDESALGEEKKQEVRNALYELEDASKAKDEGGFLSALERASGILKDVADAGSVIIPAIAKMAAGFMQ